jgi:hypothetical protein
MPNRNIDLEVIEDNPMLCKILAKNSLSPAKFSITMRGLDAKRKNIGLKFYLSLSHREPTE